MRCVVAILLTVCPLATANAQRVISVFGDTFPDATDTQVIVHRHLYVACVNVEAKQPAWVAYRVNKRDWDTENVLARNFTTPTELRAICLEASDYTGSDYQLGHLYGLQFVSATRDAHEVNQMCAVAAQRRAVNIGPWLQAEGRIRKASEVATVTVIAGQLWLEPMPALRFANEPHLVASHCWLLFTTDTVTEAYLIPQTAKQTDQLSLFTISPDALKKMVAKKWSIPR